MRLDARQEGADESPEQRRLADELLALFKQSPYLSRVFAAGADRGNGEVAVGDFPASLWLAFSGEMYRPAVGSLDALLSVNFNLLFPGRLCRVEPRWPVLGFEYLFVRGGEVRLLEICLLPSDGAATHPALKGATTLYVGDGQEPEQPFPDAALRSLGEEYARARPCLRERLAEVFACGLLLRRCIGRSQVFLNYEGTRRLNVALRDFLEAARSPAEAKWAEALEGAISRAPLHDGRSLARLMRMARDMAEELAPEVFNGYQESISFYLRACEQQGGG